jgi:small-conductance mechanosensitive channel
MPSEYKIRWLRFELRFLLFWLVPYVAVVAAILGWVGPYASSFLNHHARITLAIAFTVLWLSVLASAAARRRRESAQDQPRSVVRLS